MSSTTFSETFFLAFVQLLLQGKLRLISIGDNYGLTLVQTLTLLVLATDGEGEVSMSCLGKLYNCDASNVTGIIDGLEQKKLVARRAHANDRRIKMIHLTAEGKELQNELLRQLAGSSDQLFGTLTASEQKRFSQLLIKIAEQYPTAG